MIEDEKYASNLGDDFLSKRRVREKLPGPMTNSARDILSPFIGPIFCAKLKKKQYSNDETPFSLFFQ